MGKAPTCPLATGERLPDQPAGLPSPTLEQALPLMAATEARGEAKMWRRQAFMASHTSLQPASGSRGGAEHLLSRQQGVHFVSHKRGLQPQPRGAASRHGPRGFCGGERRIDFSQVLPSSEDGPPQAAGNDDASHLRSGEQTTDGMPGERQRCSSATGR